MKHFIDILLLVIPAIAYALWNGRNGLRHPAFDQVKTVALIMIVCVSIVRFMQIYRHGAPFVMTPEAILWWYLKAYLVAITGYGLFFPPLMNWVLAPSKIKQAFPLNDFIVYLFNRMSPTAVPDKWKWYRALGWKWRLIGYTVLFLASLLWFIMSSSRSLESYLH